MADWLIYVAVPEPGSQDSSHQEEEPLLIGHSFGSMLEGENARAHPASSVRGAAEECLNVLPRVSGSPFEAIVPWIGSGGGGLLKESFQVFLHYA